MVGVPVLVGERVGVGDWVFVGLNGEVAVGVPVVVEVKLAVPVEVEVDVGVLVHERVDVAEGVDVEVLVLATV